MLGLVAVADTPKPTSAQAVAAFRRLGIDVIMLTGDNQRTAGAIGAQLGVSPGDGGGAPQDKERKVKQLQDQGKKVAMVGTASTTPPPWPGPTWAWPSGLAPTLPSSRRTSC